MNPAFLGSRLFTSEMPRFWHKMGETYGENGLETPFLSDSFYLGHFQMVIPLIRAKPHHYYGI